MRRGAARELAPRAADGRGVLRDRPLLRQETRGLTRARFIHFEQDELVFGFMAIGTITPGEAKRQARLAADVRSSGRPDSCGRSVPDQTCQASSDFATRLSTMYVYSPTR